MPSTTVKVTGNHTLRFVWSQSSQSISGNYSNVYWELYVDTDASGAISLGGSQSWSVTIDGEEAGSGADSGGFSASSKKLLGSGTHRVYHNSDGTKTFSFSFKKLFGFTWGGTYRGEYSGSGSGTLTTIPRKSGLSVSDGTLGTAQTITADRKASGFTHTLQWSAGNKSGIIATMSSATSWNFTPPMDVANEIPNASSITMTFTLETYSGSTSVGSVSKSVTMSLPSTVVPTVDFSMEDITTYFAELGKYLQFNSRLHILATAEGAYGSTIISYKVEVDGTVYTTAEVTTGTLQTEGTSQVKVTVIDSRNRTATATKTIEVQSYNAPRITLLTVHRCNQDGMENQSGQYAKVTYSYSVSSSSSGTPTLKYKKADDTNYTSVSLPSGQSADNATYIFQADDGSAYDIELVISDSYGTASRRTSVSTGYTIMHFPANGRGVTFGGVATRSGFNCFMAAHFYGGLKADIITLERGNCDRLKESGNYFIGIYGQNRPVATVGFLSVMGTSDGAYCVQVYTTYNGQIFLRYLDNGTWAAWCNILNYT